MTARPVRRTNRSAPPSQVSLAVRRRFLLAVWLLAGVGLLARAAALQVAQGAEWRATAERQHRMQGQVPAPRGRIVDRDGVPFAVSREVFRVGLAPQELEDRDGAAEVLAEVLEVSPQEARRITGSERRWVAVPGRFPPRVRESLRGTQGVYVERELRRFYPHEALTAGVLGRVVDDVGIGGIEQKFEDHLAGVSGTAVLARDPGGRPIPGESWVLEAPRPGGEVVLTLDAALQEIAVEALEEAIESTGAEGGDLVVTDPRSGEVLAMVSQRNGATTHLGTVNTPYEPGSTLKPFTVAALLRHGKATLRDSVDTGDGRWQTNGRTISDVHPVGGRLSLSTALQVSSNVGIARFAERLRPDEQYETLRDFGFGVPTGIHLPGEVGGTLRHPSRWSRQSGASLAIGYEVSVTPIQMAMAYGALANGGVLMEPRLVRELRDSHGRVVEAFEPRAVRRVVPEGIAGELTAALVEAVEEGTGTRARLASFTVAGKSGTARAYDAAGGYERGGYYSSFVGFFPAEAPQLVVLVKLERPRGAYYGGATAAPVTRTTMEAVLAAHRAPLDRRALAGIARAQRLEESGAPPAATRVAAPAPLLAARAGAGEREQVSPPRPGSGEPGVVVPEVEGLSPRAAARRLHSLGLRVVWSSSGTVTETRPAAGTPVQPGDTIRLAGDPRGGGPVPAGSRPQGDE